MEIDQQTLQLLVVGVSLVNGVIGGLVALGATALAHLFTQAREKRKQDADAGVARRAVLRDKLEKLVGLTELHWSQCSYETRRILRMMVDWSLDRPGSDFKDLEHSVSPLDEAAAIQALYFPELAEHFALLRQATLQLTGFQRDELAAARDEQSLALWAAESRDTFGTRAAAAMEPVHLSVGAIRGEARRLIEAHLHP